MNLKQDNTKFMTVKEAIDGVIDAAPDYHDGQLEAMGAKVRVLTRFVGAAIQQLTPEQVLAIMNDVSYGWTEAE